MTRGYNLPDNTDPHDPHFAGQSEVPEDEDFEPDSGPAEPEAEPASCPDCGWTGSFDDADLEDGAYVCPVCGTELDELGADIPTPDFDLDT